MYVCMYVCLLMYSRTAAFRLASRWWNIFFYKNLKVFPQFRRFYFAKQLSICGFAVYTVSFVVITIFWPFELRINKTLRISKWIVLHFFYKFCIFFFFLFHYEFIIDSFRFFLFISTEFRYFELPTFTLMKNKFIRMFNFRSSKRKLNYMLKKKKQS